jgi:hypothetical protein
MAERASLLGDNLFEVGHGAGTLNIQALRLLVARCKDVSSLVRGISFAPMGETHTLLAVVYGSIAVFNPNTRFPTTAPHPFWHGRWLVVSFELADIVELESRPAFKSHRVGVEVGVALKDEATLLRRELFARHDHEAGVLYVLHCAIVGFLESGASFLCRIVAAHVDVLVRVEVKPGLSPEALDAY